MIPDMILDIFRLFVGIGYHLVDVKYDSHKLSDNEIKIIIRDNNLYIYYTYRAYNYCIVMEVEGR